MAANKWLVEAERFIHMNEEDGSMRGPYSPECPKDTVLVPPDSGVVQRDPAASHLRLSRPRQAGNPWSRDEIHRLRALAADGTPAAAIARALRRSESAVRNKACFHGISLRPRASDA